MMSSRTLALRSTRTQLRAVARTRTPGARFNSKQSGPSSSQFQMSHIASGLAGGSVVLLGGYLWYSFSGVKTTIDTLSRVSNTLAVAKNQVVASAPPPNEALSYLRSLSKSYVVMVPGASGYVDSTFDVLEALHDSHREEVDAIILGAYNDIRGIVRTSKSVDSDSALAVLGVLQKRAAELGQVVNNVSSDAMSPILERNPKLREAIGGSWDEFKGLGNRYGPEVKKIYDSTTNKIVDTVKSQGVTAASVASIVQTVREKSDEAKNLAEGSAKDAWDRASKQASPALERMPDVKKMLDENASSLMGIGGRGVAAMTGANVKAIWDRVRQVADSKGKIDERKAKELKDFITEKVEEAKNGGQSRARDAVNKFTGDGFENMVKMIPGGEKVLESTPDLHTLFEIAQSRSDGAQKLTRETYDEILKVLKDKAEKAQELRGESTKDVKNRA